MDNFNGDLEGRCNSPLRRCKLCEYKFKAGEIECPECGEPRQYCTLHPEPGRKDCRFHGGSTLVGIAHPLYEGKGLSRNLPTRMMEWYQASLDNPDILRSDHNIATVEARISELISRLEEFPSSEVWFDLVKTFKEYKKYRELANPKKMSEKLFELEALIARGYSDSQSWQEITHLMEVQRKLQQTEMQRRKLAEMTITPQQFQTFLGYIMSSINLRVSNNDEKMALLSDLAKGGM